MGILVIALLPVFFTGCSDNKQKESDVELLEDTNEPKEEETKYEVKRGTVTDKIQFLGNIAPIEEKNLFFRKDGIVRNVFVEEQEWVKKGDILAELEMADLDSQIMEARVNVEKAQLRLEEAQDKVLATAEAETQLEIKKLQLMKLKNNDPSPRLAIAKAHLEKAEIQMDEAKRAEQYYSQDQGESIQLRKAKADFNIAKANYNQVVQDMENHNYEISILEEEIKLAELKLSQVKEEKDPLAINDLKLAQLTLKRLSEQASMHRITAPIDGKVMSVYLTMGSSIRAYHPYIIVANPSAFELSAELTDSVVLKLSLGQDVIIELSDHPNRPINGFVRRLPYHMGRGQSSALENIDRSTRIRFIPPEDISLKVGDLARATIVLEEKEDVLYLPPEALRMYQGRRFVVVEEGDRRKRVDIKTGLHSEDRVEIEEGLQEGQIIIGQ